MFKSNLSLNQDRAYKTAPDYENPSDDNHDNRYIFNIKAKDSKGNEATQSVIIIVSNIDDEIPPVFTSLNTKNVNENQTTAITVVATDTNTITYSISGTDSAKFDINSTSGVITFKTAPDYENPNDDNNDNNYIFTAKAKDSKNNFATQSVAIIIINVLSSSFNIGNFRTGQTISYSDYDDGYYEKGRYKSFIRANDIVTDNIIELMWQDNDEAKTIKKQWII